MKWASRGLALLLPAALLVVSLSALSSTVPIQKSDERLRMEALLSSRETRVIVLGNSLVGQHIEVSALASGLGLEPTEVTQLVVPQSRLKAWYAVLRHPVFGEGHRPNLIVVASTLEDLIAESGGEGQEHLDQWVQLATVDPVPGTLLKRARAKGKTSRARLLAGIRDQAVRLVFGGDRAYAEAALEEVLGGAGVFNPSLHGRVVPVVEEESDAENGAAADSSVGGGSLPGTPPPIHAIPGFVRLAREHGAQTLFVRLPDPAGHRGVEPVLELKAMDVIREQGLGYLDLRDAARREGSLGAPEHPDSEKRKTLSRTLAQQLLVRGLLRSKESPSDSVPKTQSREAP